MIKVDSTKSVIKVESTKSVIKVDSTKSVIKVERTKSVIKVDSTKSVIKVDSVQILSVLRGHSFSSSTPQRPMTSDFEGFSIPDFIHYIYFLILILVKEPVFSLLNVQC